MEIDLHIKRKVLIEKHSIEIEKEIFFLSFLDGCKILTDRHYPNYIFYHKDGKILFQQEFKNKYFYVRHDLIWLVFEQKYNLKYTQIQALIKNILETHLKLESYSLVANNNVLGKELETHLKMENYTSRHASIGVTDRLEKKLKLEDFIPAAAGEVISEAVEKRLKLRNLE